ncbi:hypothetical protein ACSLPA_28300, partial [Escherichia coli]
ISALNPGDPANTVAPVGRLKLVKATGSEVQRGDDGIFRLSAEVEKQLLTLEKRYPQLTLFIREVLAQDPRPAYRKGEETGKTYAVWLHDFNVRWRVTDAGFEVFALEPR